ncbi:SSU ribosomal protein S3P [Candidatus Electrothrix marina]|uniref:Small ribosomal subunit protein uS3 n=3 Tax=Candidatus Electrothrix TaxID=1859128 RepID=A0A444J8C8_9BACT|nr:30S ribosomal protein S3 [Candidatus Electrothrix sp. AX5]MDU9043877.1 30S ribosomal protein S3 [Candidatus Electrothrix aestuarii]RWX44083.1 SSU ribosomal protein S3P [Candidatus Electrothrix aarhusensis]RWX49335.1 SSU ribosomal protein S3P [Candidatus Electrothrix marina]WPD22348.1 MAG: 30S ribosomal protein S3 [Candidatus Electrothrix sp. GW3-3]
MGQKVNPIGLRLNITRTWDSIWYADKDYAANLYQDQQIRKYLKKKLYHAGIARIVIERTGEKVRVKLHTARPGIVIGKKGAEIENLKRDLEQKFGRECMIDIQEVRRPEADAQLVAESIATQLERRIAFRRAMKKAISSALRFGVKGIKISCAGRLGGAEMSRTEWFKEGRVPLHTLRADIDYGTAEASTTYGIIGVKVWIFKGEVLADSEISQD